MDAVKYLKLDFAISKDYFKMFCVVFAFLVGGFILLKSPANALNVLLFFILSVSVLPFMMEAGARCEKMYYVFPAKINSMVLGRYLLLYFMMILVSAIDAIAIISDAVEGNEVTYLCITTAVCMIICLIQFPVFYKLGYSGGQLVANIIYLAPCFFILALPIILRKLYDDYNMATLTDNVTRNENLLILVCIVLVAATGWVSYKISCGICREKEI